MYPTHQSAAPERDALGAGYDSREIDIVATKKASTSQICIAALPKTPLGALWVAASPDGLVSVGFHDEIDAFIASLRRDFPGARFTRLEQYQADSHLPPEAQIARSAADQLNDYLTGSRHDFDLPIDWTGLTDFQIQALRATLAVPYGKTTTYAEIARRIGRPKAARAVGRAQATNPMPLIIPCHRVLGSDGKLHGYGGRGGLHTKAWLLEMESRIGPDQS